MAHPAPTFEFKPKRYIYDSALIVTTKYTGKEKEEKSEVLALARS